MALDMRSQVEAVLPDQIFRPLNLTPLQGFNDRHMVLDRALRSVVLGDRHLADRPHMDEQVLGQIGDQLALAEADDR